MEFAREKSILFDKWCAATKAVDYNYLKKLILLEEFKSCLPERVVVYLNEQKVASLSYTRVCFHQYARSPFHPLCCPRLNPYSHEVRVTQNRLK